MTQLLQLHHVTKKYHKHTAVNDVTVSIPTGKIIGLLGPNGSGKNNNHQNDKWITSAR